MKLTFLLPLLVLILSALSCNLTLPEQMELTPTPEIYADTLFSGYAFIDSNSNGEIDQDDEALEDALFQVENSFEVTDSSGLALITIPGELDKPVSASMQAPDGSDFILITPGEVIVQNGKKNKAEFLFAVIAQPSIQPPVILSKTFETERDLTYCTTESGIELKLDISYPQNQDSPAALIMYVHGGGWVSGDKKSGVGRLFLPSLLENGYIVVAINYRLAPDHSFPAHIIDVKCAVRYLRANAEAYQLDPHRIGVLGGSAGGHLAALLGTADENVGWDEGLFSEQSSRAQAVVDLFGPADLTQLDIRSQQSLGKKIFGMNSIDDLALEIYSPVSYITPDDPPFLILQGEEDQVVLPSQSQSLYDQLIAAGVPAELVLVENAGHGFKPTGGSINPNREELIAMVVNFFDTYLK